MFTHLDSKGQATMVGVEKKQDSHRTAIASSFISMTPKTLTAIEESSVKKGDVLATARIAAIQSAKKCSDLIPLCHPLLLSKVAIEFELEKGHEVDLLQPCGIRIFASVTLSGKTGVEMEALTAASVAALTIFDMAKAIDKNMQITDTRLEYKSGGKSGVFSTGKAGTVHAINTSKKKGEQKTSKKTSMRFVADSGIEGDAHAGKWHRQISLLDQSSVNKLIEKGLELSPGDFAENITTSGLDLPSLQIGSRLRVGDSLLEVTQIGKECHKRCTIYRQAGDCVMPREGIFAAVIEGGQVKAGDYIYVLSQTEAVCVATEKKILDYSDPFELMEESVQS